MSVDAGKTLAFAARAWEESIVPRLTEYIALPAKSPMFDPDWKAHGHIDRRADGDRGARGAGRAARALRGAHRGAHGPNEFLHVPTGIKVTACVARVVADHYSAG